MGQQELVHRDVNSLVVGEISTRRSEMSGASAEVLMPTSAGTFPAHQRSSWSFSDCLVWNYHFSDEILTVRLVQ